MNFNISDAIKAVCKYGHNDKKSNNELHIAYGIDQHFQFGAAISLTSVLMNNRDIKLNFHIFTDNEDKLFFNKLRQLAEKETVTINIYLIDKSFFSVLPSTLAWSVAIYYRFIAFEYLAQTFAQVLYLDADVICKGSLLPLSQMTLPEGCYAAVVKDIPETRQGAGSRLDEPQLNEDYFNSGVMLVSLDAWRVNQIFHRLLELLLTSKLKLQFFDQDVLNLLFIRHTRFLSEDYNCIYGIKNELKYRDMNKYKTKIKDSTILIHYIGVTKPWNSWANYPSAQFFKVAYFYSPWATQKLLGPRTPKQYKKKSRHEKMQGKIIASIISYFGYLWAKIKP
ncbi:MULTISPECIES: glycosyltransferase family 8 protein [Tenebrionibacter/Tenebrionicola group]|jgi:UDP-glucose:(galactosyl)LPS alpha-1,2-glucosyltransferase|uniref:Lipopolysaccharide 1,2-glucosyltransferase n=2 Tax=Tenebrionibacter/Tenebrionicola group TaxID=2969848 RepID=A0A8K0XWL7_9ENTR|nr:MULTISPECIES: glycosyltransferase [Tenebrionibacter/Tenebrionicola group]MBK4714377.1 lipopolysaccharide 1,2-glucosyltransferase [Tenebrionibacter intestinalis]MBV5095216.1 lipopolysaccharide 1,2-glucosyltransferase [Tenebrionicola larvae]